MKVDMKYLNTFPSVHLKKKPREKMKKKTFRNCAKPSLKAGREPVGVK